MRFLSEAGQRAFVEAVQGIEAASSAEVVVAVRPRARVWLVQHAIVGLISAIGVLAFVLYGEPEFALWQILTMPIVTGLIGALLVELVPPLYRFLAAPHARREHVRDAARAVFVDHGVHATRERSGLLVYIAVRERVVELIGDVGVVRHVGPDVLARWSEQLSGELRHGAAVTAKALAALAPAFGRALPRRADDTNELPDAIVDVTRGARKLRGSAR